MVDSWWKRFALHGGDELVECAGETLVLFRNASCSEFGNIRLRLLNLPDGKQQRGAIDAPGIRTRLSRRGIFCQRRQQVALAIRIERFAERVLFLSRQRQIVQIKHRRIIKAPLQKIVGDEAGSSHRCLAGFGDGLLEIGEGERAVVVAEFDNAINHGKRRALRAIGLRDFHDKFRAFDSGGGAARDDADAAGLVAMEKGDDPANQVQAGFGIARVRRQNLQLGQRPERHDALIGPAQRDAAVRAGAQAVEGMDALIRLREHPGRGALGRNFNRALEFDDADFVPRLSKRSHGPIRDTSPYRDWHYSPNDCGEWFQLPLFSNGSCARYLFTAAAAAKQAITFSGFSAGASSLFGKSRCCNGR